MSVEELRKVERKRGEGGVEGMLAGSCPSVCGDSPHNEVQMHLKKKKKPCRLLCSSVTLPRVFFSVWSVSECKAIKSRLTCGRPAEDERQTGRGGVKG